LEEKSYIRLMAAEITGQNKTPQHCRLIGDTTMTTKRVLILNGSPRSGGNTSILAEQVHKGVEEAGGAAEVVYLHGLDLNPCDACDSCQGMDEIDCIIEDDMQTLYPKVREADAIVYATPIYWFTVTAQIKLFMDRCYGMGGDDEIEDHKLAGKKIGVVLVYGGDDPYDSGAMNAIRTFQDMFDYIPAELVGIVYGSADDPGDIRKQDEVMFNASKLGSQLVSTQ
jgi:multimeric flavodoxin WrbA